ncbi:glycosyltransferase family 4 protein [Dyella silvae]|uniref:glycosyltransferase family 4 protein n=1 Tax=Dyella silvae TaxID=2994424 RepID=UPI002263ECF4|nr:glycosyltransferase family 4 protein [Dyella silvae]
MKVAVVTVRSSSGEEGGAERLYQALVQAFADLGHQAEEVTLRTDESTFERILENYLYFYDLDLSEYDVIVSTKAPTWMVRHPGHVCYLVHTIRAFYDMFARLFPNAPGGLLQQQDLIHLLDTKGLERPGCKAVFSIGHEVSDRLRVWNRMEAGVMHPPLWQNPFHEEPSEPFLFLPGRLHSWKRTDLVVKAMRHVRSPLRLVLAGTGEAEAELKRLAKDLPNVVFLGRVTEDVLVDHYARCLAVPFTPQNEDYGYVTLEAFASGKPVVTCEDSGEAALIVRQQNGGMITKPDPKSIAAAIDWLYERPEESKAMGRRGHDWVNSLRWSQIAETLLEAARA